MANCTACGVPNGFNESCEIRVPGGAARKIYFAEACQIASFTRDAYTNVVTDITMEVGEVFRSITARPNSVSLLEELQENQTLLQTVSMITNRLSDNADRNEAAQEASDFVKALMYSGNPLVMIVQDNAGVYRVCGYVSETGNPNLGLQIATASLTTGTALADVAANTLTLTFPATEPAPVLDSAFVIPV